MADHYERLRDAMKTTTEQNCPKADAVNEYRRQTTGSLDLHQHWGRLKYTDGIALVAETCGAHWLLDVVASYQPRLRNFEFQVWKLYQSNRTDPHRWTIECWTDTPDDPGSRRLVRQRIEYSDFPAALSPFEFWVEYGVAMLKEER